MSGVCIDLLWSSNLHEAIGILSSSSTWPFLIVGTFDTTIQTISKTIIGPTMRRLRVSSPLLLQQGFSKFQSTILLVSQLSLFSDLDVMLIWFADIPAFTQTECRVKKRQMSKVFCVLNWWRWLSVLLVVKLYNSRRGSSRKGESEGHSSIEGSHKDKSGYWSMSFSWKFCYNRSHHVDSTLTTEGSSSHSDASRRWGGVDHAHLLASNISDQYLPESFTSYWMRHVDIPITLIPWGLHSLKKAIYLTELHSWSYLILRASQDEIKTN